MDLSGAQLKYLSAPLHQVVPLKRKIRRPDIVQPLPIHSELLSSTYTQNIIVLRSGRKKTFPFQEQFTEQAEYTAGRHGLVNAVRLLKTAHVLFG